MHPLLPLLLRSVALSLLLILSASSLVRSGLVRLASAQSVLHLVNDDTKVRKISFNFRSDDPTFERDALLEQMITRAPTFWNRFDRFNPFRRSQTFPFDPIELQKDVVRLREFYRRNGFPTPRISYSASQLDTSSNRIHVILAIREGEPLFIQDIRYYEPDSSALQLDASLQEPWRRFSSSLDREIGNRYTEVERIRIQDQILAWYQNQGYAFVRVSAAAEIDTTARAADLNLFIDKGPVGYISSIAIEGNATVSDKILLRELPFSPGDRYSSKELREGQQQLFGLNLFRVALADLPQQAVDSTVDVRIRVSEAKRRYITSEVGYSRQSGIGFEGEWLNRNFFGSARNVSINFVADTGILSSLSGFDEANAIGRLPPRLFRTTLSVQQPYLFTNKLSGIVSPFIEFQNDPQLAASNDFLDINRREYGSNATLIYETLPFRPVSLQFTLSQLLSRSAETQSNASLARDLYSKSSFTLSSTLGKADNYIRPSKGLLFRPYVESAGNLFTSGLQYNKAGIEVVGYTSAGRRLNISNRVFFGKLWPFGKSADALDGRSCRLEAASSLSPADTERCLVFENRFDPVFFYAGGGSDVRGWGFQLLGPKVARADTVFVDGEIQRDENDNPVFENFVYERIGGSIKLIANIELRRRIPGFGPDWQGAIFFDAGQISNSTIRLDNFQYAVGGGIRYNTFIGVIRADLAIKLNPTTADLTDPEEVFLFENGLSDSRPSEKFLRRFGLHLSIGQAF